MASRAVPDLVAADWPRYSVPVQPFYYRCRCIFATADFYLSTDEAYHLVATIVPWLYLQLGRPAGLECRHWRRWFSGYSSLCRGHFLDTRLRYDLCLSRSAR